MAADLSFVSDGPDGFEAGKTVEASGWPGIALVVGVVDLAPNIASVELTVLLVLLGVAGLLVPNISEASGFLASLYMGSCLPLVRSPRDD